MACALVVELPYSSFLRLNGNFASRYVCSTRERLNLQVKIRGRIPIELRGFEFEILD